jgi:hypothetical protein
MRVVRVAAYPTRDVDAMFSGDVDAMFSGDKD